MHTTFFIFHYIPEFNVLQAHDKLLKRERKKKTRPVNITASLFHIHLNELLRKIVKFFRNLIYERVHMDECKKKLLNFHANKWKLNFYVGGIEFWVNFFFSFEELWCERKENVFSEIRLLYERLKKFGQVYKGKRCKKGSFIKFWFDFFASQILEVF